MITGELLAVAPNGDCVRVALSWRTVQSCISGVLAKLGAKGLAGIVREALRHGIWP